MWYCNCDDCIYSEPSSQCEVCVNFSNFKRRPQPEGQQNQEARSNTAEAGQKTITITQATWSECYRDDRCISVICSNCKQATVIAHGCFTGAAKVTYEDVFKRLPHCPRCCAEMVYPKSGQLF